MMPDIASQRKFFQSGKSLSYSFRIEQLNTLERLLKENETALYEAIFEDFQKSEIETYTTELGLLYHEIKWVKKHLKQWMRPKSAPTDLVNMPGKSAIRSEPLGVCLVIGAWNYPYLLSLHPVISAIAAGNTVVLKPSELPEQTASIMATLVAKYFPKDYFTVVTGGPDVTEKLLEQKFDKIFFTGSTRVGQIVYEAAAKHLTPVTLELGGKSPAIISKSAQIKITAQRLVWAKFLNAGQTCVAPDYVLVHETIKEPLVQAIIGELNKAEYSIEHHNYCQIINDRNFDRLAGMIDTEKVIYGGEMDKPNRILKPTLLDNVGWEDAVMQEEIFGPILPIRSFTDFNEAIFEVKSRPKPLSAYLFSENSQEKKQFTKELSFGGGGINEAVMHLSNAHLPFGGVGTSGMGNYHGKFGFDAFSHQKSILQKPTLFELRLKYSPNTKKKFWLIKQLMKL